MVKNIFTHSGQREKIMDKRLSTFLVEWAKKSHKTSYDDYCLELKAALDNKFSHLPNEGMSYAFHLDSHDMQNF